MRKHVKPADPKATIPDPERRGDLPAAGRVVTWSAHWARLAAREDIVVSDPPAPTEAPKDPPAADEQPGPAAEPRAEPAAEPHPDA